MKFLKNKFIALGGLGLILFPSLSFAAVKTFEDVIRVLNNITQWFFWAFIVAAVIYIIVIAFDILTASGDSEKLSKAKDQLIYAVIAIIIATLALSLVHLVAGIAGATLPSS